MTGPIAVKNIPDNITFHHQKDGYVSLTKLTKTELLDLIFREEKLINNKKFLEKLPDKGLKIKNFTEQAKCELKKRDDQEKLCELLKNLNVNESKNALDKLEWTDKYDLEKELKEITGENETDPFKILITHSSSSVSREKQIKIENSQDYIKSSGFSEEEKTDLNDIESYAKQLCHRFDSVIPNSKTNRFYAHKSLNHTTIKDIVKDKEPTLTATTSSIINHDKTKTLSLQESIIIQQKQIKQLKEIELRHSMEKLMNQRNIFLKSPKSNVSYFRKQYSSSEDEDTILAENKLEYDSENDTSEQSD